MSDHVADLPEVDLSKPPAEGMVRVTFLPEGRTVEFAFDTMPYEGHGQPMSFLDVAVNYGIFLDHACGGVCACTTCHLHVKQGAEGISEAEDMELGPAGDGGWHRAELAAGLPGGDRAAGDVRGRDSQVEPQLRAGRQAGARAGELGFVTGGEKA